MTTTLPVAALAIWIGVTIQDDKGVDTVSKTLDGWASSFASNDADQIIKFYRRDDSTLVVLSRGDQIRGVDDIKQMYRQSFDEAEFESSKLDDLHVSVYGGQFAVADGVHRAVTKRQSDGSQWEVTVRTSFSLAKMSTGWKIVMEHSSPLPGTPRVRLLDR